MRTTCSSARLQARVRRTDARRLERAHCHACARDRDDTAAPPADGVDRVLLIVNAPRAAGGGPHPWRSTHAPDGRRQAPKSLGLSLDWSPSRFVTTTPDEFERCSRARGLYGPPSHGWKSPASPGAGAFRTCRGSSSRAGRAGRRADGDPQRAPSRRRAPRVPRFDRPLTPNGYAWWYVDALSDDGRHASRSSRCKGASSPFCAKARARGGAVDPLDHCARSTSPSTPRAASSWSLDERGRDRVHRDASLSPRRERGGLGARRPRLPPPRADHALLTARPLGDSRIVGKVTVRLRVRVDAPTRSTPTARTSGGRRPRRRASRSASTSPASAGPATATTTPTPATARSKTCPLVGLVARLRGRRRGDRVRPAHQDGAAAPRAPRHPSRPPRRALGCRARVRSPAAGASSAPRGPTARGPAMRKRRWRTRPSYARSVLDTRNPPGATWPPCTRRRSTSERFRRGGFSCCCPRQRAAVSVAAMALGA